MTTSPSAPAETAMRTLGPLFLSAAQKETLGGLVLTLPQPERGPRSLWHALTGVIRFGVIDGPGFSMDIAVHGLVDSLSGTEYPSQIAVRTAEGGQVHVCMVDLEAGSAVGTTLFVNPEEADAEGPSPYDVVVGAIGAYGRRTAAQAEQPPTANPSA